METCIPKKQLVLCAWLYQMQPWTNSFWLNLTSVCDKPDESIFFSANRLRGSLDSVGRGHSVQFPDDRLIPRTRNANETVVHLIALFTQRGQYRSAETFCCLSSHAILLTRKSFSQSELVIPANLPGEVTSSTESACMIVFCAARPCRQCPRYPALPAVC